jgi:dienelactone hydrolase
MAAITVTHREVVIPAGGVKLTGDLAVPEAAAGIVLFAHGSGSSRHSPRNRFVADALHESAFGTLLIDLLTAEEEETERFSRHLRFDIELLSDRLGDVMDWLVKEQETRKLDLGLFGASTGAAAALIAAARKPEAAAAVVSRGGRPDLAGTFLRGVEAPTLLIVGGEDEQVLDLNKKALRLMDRARAKRLEVVPGATHLFEEAGTLEQVAKLAADWFRTYVTATPVHRRGGPDAVTG